MAILDSNPGQEYTSFATNGQLNIENLDGEANYKKLLLGKGISWGKASTQTWKRTDGYAVGGSQLLALHFQHSCSSTDLSCMHIK